MIKIGVCDDDSHSLKTVTKFLEIASMAIELDIDLSCITTRQEIIYNKIQLNELDVLFLDIDFNNNGKNGIEFALELRKINKDFKLIFLTGHFEYALMAYGCKTFDYLLKPLDITKAKLVLNRLKEDLLSSELGFIKLNKNYTVRAKDIIFIERNKSKTTIYTKDSIYETSYSLNAIKDELPDSFIRVHRSYIVNQDEIVKINKLDKTICFNNGLNCPLGQFENIYKGV